MKYLILYTKDEVVSCGAYFSNIVVALGGDNYMMTATLQDARIMLDAAGVDYSKFSELLNA
jgi:hypothetical protein